MFHLLMTLAFFAFFVWVAWKPLGLGKVVLGLLENDPENIRSRIAGIEDDLDELGPAKDEEDEAVATYRDMLERRLRMERRNLERSRGGPRDRTRN